MRTRRTSVICTILLCCYLLLASCTTSSTPKATTTPAVTKPSNTAQPTSPPPTPTATKTPPAPTKFTARILLRGVGRPDDLAFDTQGRLLFSDAYNGTISRLNADGSVSVLVRGIAGPEGIVMLSNGTLIIAEQRTNRILSLAPRASSPTVLRTLPGVPSTASCKDGVDGIALDATNNTLIIPDSPIGVVYRMSLDGKTLTQLAKGIVRPVGAAVDARGTIYVADECGGALWRIVPGQTTTRIGNFGMLDDVVPDQHGNVLVIDLLPSIHALIRMNLSTGKRETLAQQGFIEPQGLAIDAQDTIFVSDDYANIIMKLCAQPC